MQKREHTDEWILTKTGVTADWMNTLIPMQHAYEIDGLTGVVETLKRRPVLTYGERLEGNLEMLKNSPKITTKNIEKTRIEYAVTDENRDVVRRINDHVFLLNRAVRENRLTDRLYNRIESHLIELVRGKDFHVSDGFL